MKQAVMTKPGEILFRDIPTPTPSSHEVLVKIHSIGVCGSDVHVYHGKHPYTSYPVVQGHEVSGEIVALGNEVTDRHVGEKVVIMPQVYCGECYSCKTGHYNICNSLKVMGFQTTGVASEYFAVDESKLITVPESMNYDDAAMIEPIAVAAHALQRKGSISGKKVLVLGAGTIGNLVAQAATAMGASDVIITDLSDYRLEIAHACGIPHAINPTKTNLDTYITEVFGPDKADIILECVGVQSTITQAIELARKGSDIIVVGVFGDRPNVDLGLIQDRELYLIGTLMYTKEDYLTALDLLEKKLILLNPLQTKTYKFEDYLQAYKDTDEKRDEIMKLIIHIQE